jgi:hypothetical protein
MGKVNHMDVGFVFIVAEQERARIEMIDPLGLEPRLNLFETIQEGLDGFYGNAWRGVLVDKHFEHWRNRKKIMK